MKSKEIKIDKLKAFKLRDKFSVEKWEERGLNPSSYELCQNMTTVFNSTTDDLMDLINNGRANTELKSILRSGLKRFNKKDFDTEEKEFICDLFLELGDIIEVDINSELNKWLYGALLSNMLKLSKLIKPERIIETIQQSCTQCGIQLESHIVGKQDGIPDASWLVAKCNNCNELNLLSTAPNIKELKFGNYQWVDTLSKDEYSSEQALIRLEQIKFFRK